MRATAPKADSSGIIISLNTESKSCFISPLYLSTMIYDNNNPIPKPASTAPVKASAGEIATTVNPIIIEKPHNNKFTFSPCSQ